MSDVPDDKSFTGTTPTGTLYYTAHVSTFEDAPPMGSWRNLNDVSAHAAAYNREFLDAHPEASLNILLPQHFAEVNRAKLLAFAESKGTTLKTDRNPFGTLDWLEYELSTASWPPLESGTFQGTWTVQTDGLHVLATFMLPQIVGPSMLRLMDFPQLVTQALQNEFTDWNLKDERLALGWNWHGLSGSRPLYGGLIYQIPDTGLVMSGRSTLSSSIPTYVGTDLITYLPLVLADTVTMQFTTRILESTLNEAGNLSVTPIDLPQNLKARKHRVQQQNKLLDSWRDISQMQRTLDSLEDVLLAGRTWNTALESFRNRGFQWKPTGLGLSQRMVLHGPYKATMQVKKGIGWALEPSVEISETSLTGHDLPTSGLKRVIRNVDHYRQRLVQQATSVKEGIDVQGSLMSARSAEQSMVATLWGVGIAVVALVVAALSPFAPDDWKFGAHHDPPAATQAAGSAPKPDPTFGVTYPASRPSTLAP